MQTFLIYDNVHFIFFLKDCVCGIIAKILLPNLRSQRFYAMFSSGNLIVVRFLSRFMAHLLSSFLYKVRGVGGGCIIVPAQLIAKTIISLLNCFCTFIEHNRLDVYVYFWILHSIPLICMSTHSPAPQQANYVLRPEHVKVTLFFFK